MLDLIRDEPAITRGIVALAGVVIAYFGWDLDPEVVYTALVALGFASVATRRKVIPAHRARRVPK